MSMTKREFDSVLSAYSVEEYDAAANIPPMPLERLYADCVRNISTEALREISRLALAMLVQADAGALQSEDVQEYARQYEHFLTAGNPSNIQ